MAVQTRDQSVARATSTTETFGALWDHTVRRHHADPFLIFQADNGVVASWDYGDFDRIVETTAQVLRDHGVAEGDGVHLCLRNCPAFVAVWLAAAKIGAWINPVDPTTSASEIAHQLSRTGARLGIHSVERRDVYLVGAADAGIPLIEVAESPDDVVLGSGALVATGARARFSAAPSRGAGGRVPTGTDRLAVMFTSGTTSQPKGVVLTQRNYAVVAAAMADAARLRREHRWLVTLPMFHANAQYYCFAPAIAVGASVALTERFSASRWVSQARELGATHASLFAAPIRMILARTPADQPPAKLQHVWFAQNLGAQHHAEFARLAGVAPRQLYGMTETVAAVCFDRSEPPVHDRIGRPLDGRQARLVDPTTTDPVAQGVPGIIAVAGRRGDDLFDGYLDDPATTERTFVRDDDGVGWMLTGDLAVDPGDGGWRFVGRLDDVIKVAGENVSLAETEAIIAQAPGVLEAAVLAEDDPVRDKRTVAYVVPRDGAEIDPEALDRWAADHLTKAARPVAWHVLPELPRTSVGKVRRFKLNSAEKGQ